MVGTDKFFWYRHPGDLSEKSCVLLLSSFIERRGTACGGGFFNMKSKNPLG